MHNEGTECHVLGEYVSDFDLYRPSEEHDMLRDAVRSLAEAKIAPFAAEVDEGARFPQEALDALVANDL
ncbi:acyl-CoA dehydrogenase family protein, partial [Streptomyces sp. NPDC094472]|uniref:acyl-CoA dehydrogenase family protein n=1 Tax=unclassified Streptomyces TaxID=2593676 RepID=UPI00332CF3EC